MKPFAPGFLLLSVFLSLPAFADCTDRAAPRAQRQTLNVAATNYKIQFRQNMPEEQRQVDDRLMTILARMAVMTKSDILVTSGFRNCQKNFAVRGAQKSAHLKAIAVDFQANGYNSEQLRTMAFRAGANGAGSYYGANGVFHPAAHLDIGNPRTWKYGPRQ